MGGPTGEGVERGGRRSSSLAIPPELNPRYLRFEWSTAYMMLSNYFRSKIERDVEAERLELIAVLRRSDDSRRVDALRHLATRIGASTSPLKPGYGDANLPELVHNVQFALQTKAMIAAVKTSSNYVIVSVILCVIALLSMVAAFIAALC